MMMNDLYDEVPLATPYPWGPEELESLNNIPKKKRAVIGSGYAALHSQMQQMKPYSRAILEGLLARDGKKPHPNEQAAHQVMKNHLDTSTTVSTSAGTAETEVLKMAQDGKMSLFLSILRVIQDSPPPVSTRHLLRTCSLAITPAAVPPHMDCKEMVLAALFFLSSKWDNNGETLKEPSLPLIRPTVEVDDLEKRAFEKYGDWSLEDAEFLNSVRGLERVFGTSSISYTCLGRQRRCPRGFTKQEEKLLLLKGTMPAKSGSKKRKAPSASRQATPTS